MSVAHVGARFEVVESRKISDRRDWAYLALLAVVSLLAHGWEIANNPVTAKDSIGFARYGWNLLHPSEGYPPEQAPRTAINVLQDPSNHHPPGFPLMVGVTAKVVRKLQDAELPAQLARSTQVASAAASLLLIFPAYAIGRLLFGQGVGLGVGLLTQLLPVFSRDATDGLNDCAHLSAVAFSLLFAVRGLRRPRIGQFLLAGLFGGLAYLVRPEGLLVIIGLAIVTVRLVIKGRWPVGLSLGLLVAAVVGATISASPYMLMIGRFTNKPSGDLGAPVVNPRLKMIAPQGAVNGPPFAAAFRDLPVTERIARTPVEFVRELLKTTHYSVGALGLLGIWLLRKRFHDHPELLLLALYPALHASLLFALGLWRGYLSERHTLPIAFCLTYFAVGGITPLCEQVIEYQRRLGRAFSRSRTSVISALGKLMLYGVSIFREWLERSIPNVIIVGIIIISCLPDLVKVRHRGRIGQVQAGEYLRGRIDKDDHLYDPYEWAGYYSMRTFYRIPPDPPMTAGRCRWIVWEDGDRDNSLQSPRWAEAKAFIETGRAELMFRSEVPNVKNQILVYRMPFTADEVARDAR